MVMQHVDSELLESMLTNEGSSLKEISDQKPVLLLFLRHFGCNFCKEALEDISAIRTEIEATGAVLVFVHMADTETGKKYFEKYNLSGVTHISDPECIYYERFGLVKGTIHQLFGLQTWMRGFGNGGLKRGFQMGKQLGDAFQMPGIFLIHQGIIKESYIHRFVSDRPDYLRIARCCEVV